MKKFVLPLLASIASLYLFSCSVPLNAGMTLPNGVELSSDEVAILKSLQPEAIAIMSKYTGSSSAKSLEAGLPLPIGGDPLAMQAELEAFMRDRLGPDYKKYIVEEHFSKSVEIDPAIASKAISVPVYEDGYYYWVMLAEAKSIFLPWGTYNWTSTDFHLVRKLDGAVRTEEALSDGVGLSDSVTAYRSITEYNDGSILITGNLVGGFYPPRPTGLQSTHTLRAPVVPGGSNTWAFSWW